MALPSTFRMRDDPLPEKPGWPQPTGIMVVLVPSTDPGWMVQLQRSTVGTTSGGVTPDDVGIFGPFQRAAGLAWDAHPLDEVTRYYRARHVGERHQMLVGSWTPWTTGHRPTFYALENMDAVQASAPWPIPRQRPMLDGDYAASADQGDGMGLTEGVVQTDGAQGRVLSRGRQTGQARHNDAITFSPVFNAPPTVRLKGGILFEPRAKWGGGAASSAGGLSSTSTGAPSTALPQYEDLEALNVTAAGFVVRARLRQKAAISSAVNDDFVAGNAASTIGATVACTLSTGGAVADLYTVNYKTTLEMDPPIFGKPAKTYTLVVGIETNDGSGYVERATHNFPLTLMYGDSSGPYEYPASELLTVAGLGPSDGVQLRAKSESGSAGAFVVHGYNLPTDGDPDHGVTYNVAADNYASKTPDAADRVSWEASI